MQILRVKEVARRLGISRSTLYVWIKEGRFPSPIRLGVRMVGWKDSDVNQWIIKDA